MKTIVLAKHIVLILVIACSLLAGCVREPSYGLIFTAFDPKTDTVGIYQLSENGQKASMITTLDEAQIFSRITDISADGKRILVVKPSKGTYEPNGTVNTPALFYLDDREPILEEIQLPQGVINAALSPDGQQIAVSDSNSLWVGMSEDIRRENLQLIEQSQYIFPNSISWSPDGKYIAYTKSIDWSTVSKTYEKYAFYTETDIVNLTTLEIQMLTDGSMGCFGPKWSPNNKWIAVTCKNVDDLVDSLILLSPDGRDKKILQEDGLCYSYDWSDDGKLIAYLCIGGGKTNIFYSKVDEIGQNVVPNLILKNINEISDIVWTPDGKNLIMVMTIMKNIDTIPIVYEDKLFITNLDGSDQRILDDQLENYQNLQIFKNKY